MGLLWQQWKEPMSRNLKTPSWRKGCDRKLLIFFTVLVRTKSSRNTVVLKGKESNCKWLVIRKNIWRVDSRKSLLYNERCALVVIWTLPNLCCVCTKAGPWKKKVNTTDLIYSFQVLIIIELAFILLCQGVVLVGESRIVTSISLALFSSGTYCRFWLLQL